MKERPILMNGPMVRATLEGRKTQTRRPMKTQLVYGDVCGLFESWYLPTSATGGTIWPNGREEIVATCPYGQPGDRLWVRETFAEIDCRLTYRADTDDGAHCVVKRWIPSIHMPRRDSRTLLEITAVRVERLHSISTDDIIAEGLSTTLRGHDAEVDLRDQWRALWESTGGNWDANPWLWCVSFRRLP